MNWADLLERWTGVASPKLFEILLAAKRELPDYAVEIDALIAKLDAGVSQENIIAVTAAILSEAKQIARGQFSGTAKVEDAS